MSRTMYRYIIIVFYSRVSRGGSLALGEAYMDGWWDSQAVDQFICKLIRAEMEGSIRPLSLLIQRLSSKFFNMQDRIRCRRVVEEHYDLGNDLYELMLDPYMQYTCAYWPNAKNLNQAQEHKLEQICRKLEINSGDQLLDLGCGFGGLAKFAAENYNCKVTGYNISKQQMAWARNACKDLPVELIEKDYREAHGEFDKVVSAGLCEHVGYKNYRTLMQVAHRCLKPGGLFLLHCIGGNISTVTTDPWLEKYIFPGSVMPSAKQLSQASEGLFILEDWHNFGVDYDKTCMAWFENFDNNWSKLKSDKYNDRFYRMWKYYLLLCAGSFRARKNQNWELVLSKDGKIGGYNRGRSPKVINYSNST